MLTQAQQQQQESRRRTLEDAVLGMSEFEMLYAIKRIITENFTSASYASELTQLGNAIGQHADKLERDQ